MPKTSFTTFTGEEFAQALSAGTLREVVIVTGMAKKGDDSQSILFAPGKECGDWIPVPVKMIDQVDWLGKISCKDHTHDYVRLPSRPVQQTQIIGSRHWQKSLVAATSPLLVHAWHRRTRPPPQFHGS